MNKPSYYVDFVLPALSASSKTLLRFLLTIGLLMESMSVFALQALDDSALAGVSGKDGLSLTLEGNLSADSINVTLDSASSNEASLHANTVSFDGVGATGVISGNAGLSLDLDAGTRGSDPLLHIGFGTTQRSRLRIDDLTVSGLSDLDNDPGTPDEPWTSGRTYGTWAFDFDANVQLLNKGIFNTSYDKAYLLGEITNGDLFYRQDSNAWMAMHDFSLKWEIPEGVLGIDSQGIVHKAGALWGEAGFSDAATSSNIINLSLDFEYILGAPTGNEFEITQDARGLMHFGWLGSVKNAEVKWMPGGIWYNSTGGVFDPYGANAVTSNGLRFSSQWDYVSQAEAATLGAEKEFRWRLGETADVASADKSRVNFELGDWTIWGDRTAAKPASHYFPLIALDVISGAGQGPGGLCWGHGQLLDNPTCSSETDTEFLNMQPGIINNYGINETDENALALIVRGGQLQSYSRKVRLLERDAVGNETTREFNWGLIYSLANVNANIYLYPGITRDGSNVVVDNQGVIADILLMSQTLEGNYQGQNWDHGTHLMIADTEANMGIGFISSSFVVAGNDTRIWVKPQIGSDFYSGGLDILSPQARFNYRATFGGGLLPGHAAYGSSTQAQTVNGSNIDLNLEGLVNLRFSPSDPASVLGRNFLAYSGALRLGSNEGNGMIGATSDLATCGSDGISDCGSYISLAEPSQPDAAIKLANITGDIVFSDGRVDVVGTDELDSVNGSEPQMVLANKIKIGYAAANQLNPILDSAGLPQDGGNPVVIDNIMLGNANLGRMVIPSAQIYSSITLEPQSAAVPFSP